MQPYIRYVQGVPEPEPEVEEEEIEIDTEGEGDNQECAEEPCDEEELTLLEQYKDLLYFLAIMGIQAFFLIIICICCSVHAKKKAAAELKAANKPVAKKKKEQTEDDKELEKVRKAIEREKTM